MTLPGQAETSQAIQFENGRAGVTASGLVDGMAEPVTFTRGPMPLIRAVEINHAWESAGKDVQWEGKPKERDGRWGLRLVIRNDEVIRATLYTFDPNFPGDFDKARAVPVSDPNGTILHCHFVISDADGAVWRMGYIVPDSDYGRREYEAVFSRSWPRPITRESGETMILRREE